MLIDVQPSERYLKILKSSIEHLDIKDLKDLKRQVIKDPLKFKPFLLDAIKQLLNS